MYGNTFQVVHSNKFCCDFCTSRIYKHFWDTNCGENWCLHTFSENFVYIRPFFVNVSNVIFLSTGENQIQVVHVLKYYC